MNIADLSGGSTKLRRALLNMESAWRDTGEVWTDQSRRQFEENHLRDIGPQVKTTIEAANRLAVVLAQAQRACES
jgi:hypothetical protein